MESLEALRERLAKARVYAETGRTPEMRAAFAGVVRRLEQQIFRRESRRAESAAKAAMTALSKMPKK